MYIEFVRNLLLQSEASGEQRERESELGELEAEREDRETWRRTGERREKKERREGNERGRHTKKG